jgi:hypothetical protein
MGSPTDRPGNEPANDNVQPGSPFKHQPLCQVCGDSRKCLTCAGTGVWYAGTVEEDECSSCGGTGYCPDCP